MALCEGIILGMGIDPRARYVEDQLYRLGLSVRFLASRIGKDPKTVLNWLKGSNKPRDGRIFESMIATLREYEIEKRNYGAPVRIRPGATITIPLLPGIAAGYPSSNHSDVDSVTILDNGSGLEKWARTADGNSMSPFIEPGDVLIFEARRPEPGHVVHAYSDGEDCVKVWQPGKRPLLRSINRTYGDIEASKYKIKGVLIGIQRRMAKGVRYELFADAGHYYSFDE